MDIVINPNTCSIRHLVFDLTRLFSLKDSPLWLGTIHECSFFVHRYRCQKCGKTFSEDIPFKYPGTRITYRAANWIKGFLQRKISIKAIQELTSIHWDTIRKVQSQYGRDVLGVVRLNEARKHKASAKKILADIGDDTDKETKQTIKQMAKTETQEYSKLKQLRWPLLTNSGKLSEKKNESLQAILQDHQDLAVCYAMKEEMCRLYELTDYQQALDGWTKWFEAAKASEIPALEKFATQKEKRLPGLAAHAVFPISTGKLEGFNNKIKVAERIAYGYRDEEYFFTLIRYLSLPSVRCSSHNFP